MVEIRCPICRRRFESERSPAMPFCSETCRMIDLSRWLDEKYGLPVEPDAADHLDQDDDHNDDL